MQYLYGSAEAAVVTRQNWDALVDHVGAKVRQRPADSVILADGATLQAPRYVPCGGKPFAAVFDVDETVLLNYGFESWQAAGGAYSPERWSEWERTGAADVAPTPGAKAALDALRGMGVTVIFNTNRHAGNAAATAQAIEGAGLGPAEHGTTLFLQGDDDTGGHKDARRARIASRYCVLALGGDQLGDISDLFNAIDDVRDRRAAIGSPAIVGNWGEGWFLFPNPVYGPSIKGGMDDVFPADKRWAPGGATAEAANG
ncbi:HAD family acid phosphatase [Stakelama saccharophila]|uniref:HAD family acid phosphatase n=2 Tax=Stakelama saccharophila TaxID=3075605 RepID=A0ABZ0BFC1_9SPHN|nr:HAD family acid phosphatase [Stakelama sp. W311]WNO55179.1 HAD family acid phosphatase [Stakelama sp. W311]